MARDHGNNDPSSTKKISQPGDVWLRKYGYTTYEIDLGDLLKAWMNGYGNSLADPHEVDRFGNVISN